MARILIIGCGCRGRALAARLSAAGHAVRGTTRDAANANAIRTAGAEPYVGDPDRIATLMDALYGTTIVCWLMATADHDELHAGRIRMLCEKLVDTPVRGLVYEAAGPAAAGVPVVEDARARWNMPVEVVDTAPESCPEWTRDMAAAVGRLLAPR